MQNPKHGIGTFVLRHSVWMSLIGLILAQSLARAAEQPFEKYLTQVDPVKPPSRGSLAGEYAKTTWSPGDLVQGAYSLSLGFKFPSERGALVYPIQPQYSPLSGVSEWGLGMSFDLSIRRFRDSGGLDFQTDGFLSPWGQLVRGRDGNYYPKGLNTKVRVRFVSAREIHAYTEDGATLVFGREQVLNVPGKGIYAWYLVEARDNRQQHAIYNYELSAENYFYLKEVLYGGVENDFQYKLEFEYDHFSSKEAPFVDYRSTLRQELNRRVKSVIIKSGPHLLERYRYLLGYEQVDLGPTFYLTSVQQRFASGGLGPLKTFQYETSAIQLKRAKWRSAKKMSQHLKTLGTRILSPSESTQVDFDNNGLMSLELPRHQYGVLEQTESEYKLIPTQKIAQPDDACMPSVLSDNPARRLVRLRGPRSQLEVIRTYFVPHELQTHVIICTREGQRLEDLRLKGDWDLNDKTWLIDLDHHHKPDLIHFDGNHYSILRNNSSDSKIEFSPLVSSKPLMNQYGNGILEVEPQQVFIQDLNGDGLPDIIAQMDNGFLVWYGKGQGEFETRPSWMQVFETRSQEPGSEIPVHFDHEAHLSKAFVDLNGDGLADLIIFGTNQINVFLSDGRRFVERTPKSFLKFPSDLCRMADLNLYFGDFSGEGNVELLMTCVNEAYTFDFTSAYSGLLTVAKDGQGNNLYLSYDRASPETNIDSRIPVLQKLVIEKGGKSSETFKYQYQGAVTHSLTQALLGFKQVSVHRAQAETKSEYLINDETSPLPEATYVMDKRSPDIWKQNQIKYERELFQQIPYYRKKSETAGYAESKHGGTALTETSFNEYALDFCPSQIVEHKVQGVLTTAIQYAKPEHMVDNLGCLPSHIALKGTHSDGSRDFEHAISIRMNGWGQTTQLASDLEGGAVLQEIKYGKNGKPKEITVPGKGTYHYEFDELNRLLSVTQPDQVVVTASYLDSDLLGQLLTSHGEDEAGKFRQSFVYDEQNRLAAEWNNIYPSSGADPLLSYAYHYAKSGSPAWVLTAQRLDQATGVIHRQEYELSASDGAERGKVVRSDAGWVGKNLTYEYSDSHDFINLKNRLFKAVTGEMTDTAFFNTDQSLANEVKSELGFTLEGAEVYQENKRGQSAYRTHIAASELVQEKSENQKFHSTETQTPNGARTSFIDESGNQYFYKYDALDRLTEVSLEGKSSSDEGFLHKIKYDSLGRIQEVSRKGMGRVHYSYLLGTDLVTQKSYFGNEDKLVRNVNYKYDGAGRLLEELHEMPKIKFLLAETQKYLFSYDGKHLNGKVSPNQIGFLTEVQGPDYLRVQQYRADGKLTGLNVRFPNWKDLDEKFEYQTDGSERLRTIAYKGNPLNYVEKEVKMTRQAEWDHLGRISGIKFDNTVAGQFHYDSMSQLSLANFSNQNQIEFKYDPSTLRLELLKGNIGQERFLNSWMKNERGLVEQEEFGVLDQTLKRRYSYTDNRLLAGDTDNLGIRSYTYSSAGLLESFSAASDATTIAPVKNAWIIKPKESRHELDSLGRVVLTPDLEFVYGPNGRIEMVKHKDGSVTAYGYDENGKRIVKKKNGKIVEAYVDDFVLEDRSIYEPVRVNGIVAGYMENDQFHPVMSDVRGSVLKAGDGSPSFISPYGERKGPRPEHSNVLDYVALGYDPDLRAYRMGQRDYDPFLKRFLTPDPFVFEHPEYCLRSPVECNLYGYAGGDPVGFVDPTGKYAHIVVGAAFGAAVNAASLFAQPGNMPSTGQVASALAIGAASGGLAAATGGASLTTSIGANMAISAGTSAANQMAVEGKSHTQLDFGKIGVSAVGGGLAGALGTAGGNAVGKMVDSISGQVGGTLSAVGETVSNVIGNALGNAISPGAETAVQKLGEGAGILPQEPTK